MTARPPRASTKGDTRRGKPRGATQSERDKADKPRSASVVPTDRYERIGDDDVLEVTELPGPAELRAPPRLRLLVLETAPHLASAQGAIVAAGHAVAAGAAGQGAVDKLRLAIAGVDAMLVGMPGGEPLIEAALAQGVHRPVVIAAWTAGAVEATRRAAAAGADLATVRPHHVERLAPILLAAGRLIEQRRLMAAPPAPDAAPAGPAEPAVDPDLGPDLEPDLGLDLGPDIDIDIDVEPDADPAGLLPAELFAQAALRELERARSGGHALAVAMFVVDVAPPPPPPALRGILRARAGNALVHALRDVDLATELDQDRFLVVMPNTDRTTGAESARRIISAVAAGDPVTAVGRTFPPRVIGAVASAAEGDALDLPRLVRDVTQLLEQAQATGASLAVES